MYKIPTGLEVAWSALHVFGEKDLAQDNIHVFFELINGVHFELSEFERRMRTTRNVYGSRFPSSLLGLVGSFLLNPQESGCLSLVNKYWYQATHSRVFVSLQCRKLKPSSRMNLGPKNFGSLNDVNENAILIKSTPDAKFIVLHSWTENLSGHIFQLTPYNEGRKLRQFFNPFDGNWNESFSRLDLVAVMDDYVIAQLDDDAEESQWLVVLCFNGLVWLHETVRGHYWELNHWELNHAVAANVGQEQGKVLMHWQFSWIFNDASKYHEKVKIEVHLVPCSDALKDGEFPVEKFELIYLADYHKNEGPLCVRIHDQSIYCLDQMGINVFDYETKGFLQRYTWNINFAGCEFFQKGNVLFLNDMIYIWSKDVLLGLTLSARLACYCHIDYRLADTMDLDHLSSDGRFLYLRKGTSWWLVECVK